MTTISPSDYAKTEFGKLVTEAVRIIKAHENKKLDAVQDELGITMGREGRSYIEHLRKGNIPPQIADVEKLARLLAYRQGLDRDRCGELLKYAGHPQPQSVIQGLWSDDMPNEEDGRAQKPADLREQEPFVATAITHPHQFYGRAREAKRIFGWWQRVPLTHTALIGPKRSGKTSFCHYLRQVCVVPPNTLRLNQKQDWLAQPRQFRWVYADFADPRFSQIEDLLRHLLVELGLPIPKPCTLSSFLSTIAKPPRSAQVNVVLMDNADKGLTRPDLTMDFWDGLRALVDNSANDQFAFLVTARADLVALARAQAKPSSFFTVLNTIPLGPLQRDEAREVIDSSPILFSSEDKEWILDHSGCWPARLQALCKTRLDALRESNDGETNSADDSWKAAGTHEG